jgi:hypothetical protein
VHLRGSAMREGRERDSAVNNETGQRERPGLQVETKLKISLFLDVGCSSEPPHPSAAARRIIKGPKDEAVARVD